LLIRQLSATLRRVSKAPILYGCAALLVAACAPSDEALFGPASPPLSVSGSSNGGDANAAGSGAGSAVSGNGNGGGGAAGATLGGGGMAAAGKPTQHPAAGDGSPPDPGAAGAVTAAGAAGADNGAGGSAEPPEPSCGNGVIEAGEECDGGTGHDGCDAECRVVCSAYGSGALKSDDHHCYKGYDEHDFEAAKQDCAQRGAHLATISSEAENKIVLQFVNESKFVGGFEDMPLSSQGNLSYGWITGESFKYTNWAADEPNSAVSRCTTSTIGAPRCYEHCVAVIRDGTWTDQRCDRADGYVCEWEPPGTK
jgi:hypothetical protein